LRLTTRDTKSNAYLAGDKRLRLVRSAAAKEATKVSS
jgi:hypothetical protein